MEIKIEVGEEKFKEILEKQLEAFTADELKEICRKALVEQLSKEEHYEKLFFHQDYWNKDKPNDILESAARSIDFGGIYQEVADKIIKYIKENHNEIIHEIVIRMFINGLGDNIFNSDKFKQKLSQEIYSRMPVINQ